MVLRSKVVSATASVTKISFHTPAVGGFFTGTSSFDGSRSLPSDNGVISSLIASARNAWAAASLSCSYWLMSEILFKIVPTRSFALSKVIGAGGVRVIGTLLRSVLAEGVFMVP